ncbi:MAG: glycosyl hydrolase [Planctomycetota bacterium]
MSIGNSRRGLVRFVQEALATSAIVAGVAVAGPSRAGAQDPLAADFADPPASARPWTYWMWTDGNLSREGITADLEAMARAGLGGAIIMEVDVGVPRGPVAFLSPEWRGLFRHVVSEAERLGLHVTLNAGPGWTGSGGPWVKPESSMQHIVASAVEVSGPRRLDEILPRPPRRPAFFGDGGLPPEIEKAKDEFYRDVAVLAFPTPEGTYRIEDIDEKALYVRAPYSSQPGVRPFLPAPADHPELPPGATIRPARIVDLSERLEPDGRLYWDVPEGRWTILRFGRTATGANTRPAPRPGLGLECDKFDRVALEAHFDAFVGTLLREIGSKRTDVGWTFLHIDSWEMGAQNWTRAFREEFRGRRGYDPLPYLPVVTGRAVESLEISERFLWDLRQTAQELVVENHAEHLKRLGRREGFGLSIEPYDMNPCADMTLGAVADVPMCEFWLYGFDTSFSVIEAASVAHTWGKPIVAAEAFTSVEEEAWRAHPASMKALGDWAFSAGVNRIVFHRYQHQPWLDLRPGMTMGPYGVHWERTQTWWDMVPAYHAYLARCQVLLRRGLPVADVLFLVAEGAPQVFRPPSSAVRGSPPDRLGYGFDGCAPEALLERAAVEDGRLVFPDGMSYRVLVLPERETMTPRLLRKVKALVEAGATAVGPRPRKSPGLSGYPGCDAEVERLAAELWGPCDGREVTERALGKGRVVWVRGPGDRSPAAARAKAALERARWIWLDEGSPAAQAPVSRRCFRRRFEIPAGSPVESASLILTADNAFEAWVNDRPAGRGDNFHVGYLLDVTSLVRPGANVLAVEAENGGDAPNPAGLIGALVVRVRGGEELAVLTGPDWEAARPAGGDGTAGAESRAARGGKGEEASAAGAPGLAERDLWSPALDLGPLGTAPWGAVSVAGPAPEQYGDFSTVVRVLEGMGIPPDFEADARLRWIHRRDGERDIYFVANPEDRAVAASSAFRVSGKAPEVWDPLSGGIRRLPEFAERDGRTIVPLRFEPHGSLFVVFRASRGEAKPARGNFARDLEAVELAGPWEVSFDPEWGGPEKVTFERLEDWSARPEEGIRYYSGVATYRKSFDVRRPPADGERLVLDLGTVRNMARVRLNGRDLGVVWCAPWRVDVTHAVRRAGNRLEIDVANLWPNRLIGDERLPPDCEYGRGGNLLRVPEWVREGRPRPSPGRYAFATWRHYSKDSPLLPSGLLGPVSLRIADEGQTQD